MNYYLPTEVEIDGVNYAIRSDYRAILDIIEVFNDLDMSKTEQMITALYIFYVDVDTIPQESLEEAAHQMTLFVDGGEEQQTDSRSPKLVDWEKDFRYISAPVSRILGGDIRGFEYLHWWTFLSAFMEIGECTFAQIVSIRSKKARHKPLADYEKEWYRQNRQLVDLKQNYSSEENDLLRKWM